MFLSFIDNLLLQIVFLPFPSLELRDWMKSLRLHKYTDRLLGLTYDDLLTLTDRYSLTKLFCVQENINFLCVSHFRDLQKLVFTDGAKGKFLKQLSLMRERPQKIKELQQSLEVMFALVGMSHII